MQTKSVHGVIEGGMNFVWFKIVKVSDNTCTENFSY
jgi:hypothetical protein